MYIFIFKRCILNERKIAWKTAYSKNSPSNVWSEYISQKEIVLGNKTTELCCIDYVTQNMYCF